MSPEDKAHALTPWVKEESWGAVVGADELRKLHPSSKNAPKFFRKALRNLISFLTNPEFDEAAWS